MWDWFMPWRRHCKCRNEDHAAEQQALERRFRATVESQERARYAFHARMDKARDEYLKALREGD